MGRKKKTLDYSAFDAAVQVGASIELCASILGISADTIERRLREDHKMRFQEYKDTKFEPIKIKLQQKALNLAFSGNVTMLIFALKNYCGWSDKKELDVKDTTIKLKYNLNDE